MRLTVFIAVACLMTWAVWRIIVSTAASDLADTAPNDALKWSAHSQAALDHAAYKLLQDGDLDAAKNLAERSLRSNPLDDQALVLLALIAERNHDTQRAGILANMAGKRTWRNPGAQLWLFERAVRNRDYPLALQHADAILREYPFNDNFRDLIFPTLAAFINYQPSLEALENLLGKTRSWRAVFLQRLPNFPNDQARLFQLFSFLVTSAEPPSAGELLPYMQTLLQKKRYAEAYQIWLNTVPAAQRVPHLLYNGDFTQPVDGLPFNWVLTSRPGADVDIVALDAAKEKDALRVQFSGARVDFAGVRQLLLLSPGRHEFSGKVKADDLQAARGLWWAVSCADGSKQDLGQTNLVFQTLPWTDFTMDFVVPDGCPAQQLQLLLPARIPSEKRIEGQISYRSLRISRASRQGF
jgi:hypothetical protein